MDSRLPTEHPDGIFTIIVGTDGHIDHGKSTLVRALTGIDPDRLPDAVVCYTDTTIAMPILTHYALARHKPRKLRRLYDQRDTMMKAWKKEYFAHNKVAMLS